VSTVSVAGFAGSAKRMMATSSVSGVDDGRPFGEAAE
jgi:hypothetical protein